MKVIAWDLGISEQKKAAKIDLLKNGPNNELKFVWQAGGGTAWALKTPLPLKF